LFFHISIIMEIYDKTVTARHKPGVGLVAQVAEKAD
jgi:hypothetical protein